MGFRAGARAKVWSLERQSNYTSLRISISRKQKDSDEYIQDFGGFISLVGTAHKQGADIKEGDIIKIGDCEATTYYNKETGVTRYSFTVFNLEDADSDGSETKHRDVKETPKKNAVETEPDSTAEDECPF